jgi:hypothetical protein
MNYPYLIPGMQGDPASFVASATLVLGSVSKPLDARTLVTVNYASIIPADTVVNYSFRIRPGGEPQLSLNETKLDTTKTILTFYVDGGIAGRSYEVLVGAILASGAVRSDSLTVDVMGDSCVCSPLTVPPYLLGNVSSDGSVLVNTATRFFVSSSFPVNPNVLDRWFDTTTANIYDYVSDGLSTFWELAGGSSGGGGGGAGANIITIQPINPDGTTTLFTMAATSRPVTVTVANTLMVSVDGVWQEPVVDYQAAGNQIEFTQAPSADSRVFIQWFAPPGSA